MKSHKKIITFTFIFIIGSLSNIYYIGIIEAFFKFPIEILYQITPDEKKKGLQLYYEKQPAIINSRYNTPIEITKVDTIGNFLCFKTSDVSSTEIKVIKADSGQSYIFHNSITCGPSCDSNITIFNDEWYYVPTEKAAPSLLKLSKLDFFDLEKAKEDGKNIEELIEKLTPLFYELHFSAEKNDLIVRLDISRLDGETKEALKPYFTETKTFSWTGSRF